MLVAEVFPSLAAEPQELLLKPSQANWLRRSPLCKSWIAAGAGMSSAQSSYTHPKPEGSYPGNLETIELALAEGWVLLEVVNGVMAQIEVLTREDVRKTLLAAIP